MKRLVEAEGVTEYAPGPHLAELEKRFGGSGAVILMLDVSGSMAIDKRLEKARAGCVGFLDDAVAGGYEAGLLLWHHEIAGFEPPQKGAAGAYRLLKAARVNGGNVVTPGLTAAAEHLLSMDVTDRVIAVFGDGDLGPEQPAIECARKYQELGVRIVTLGLGEESARALSVIASESEATQQMATSASLSEDIRSMASGLTLKRKKG